MQHVHSPDYESSKKHKMHEGDKSAHNGNHSFYRNHVSQGVFSVVGTEVHSNLIETPFSATKKPRTALTCHTRLYRNGLVSRRDGDYATQHQACLLACLLACLRSLRSRKQANAEYGHEETSGRDAVRTRFCMDACSVFIEKRAKTLKNKNFLNLSTSYSFATQNTFFFMPFLPSCFNCTYFPPCHCYAVCHSPNGGICVHSCPFVVLTLPPAFSFRVFRVFRGYPLAFSIRVHSWFLLSPLLFFVSFVYFVVTPAFVHSCPFVSIRGSYSPPFSSPICLQNCVKCVIFDAV